MQSRGVRDRTTRPLILAALVAALAACSAGAAPSPSPTPSPTLWPINPAAYDAAVKACQSPLHIGWEFIGPAPSPAMVPGYHTVSLVPVSYSDLDGKVVPVPGSIQGPWRNGIPDEQSEPGFGAIARPIGGGADVLVCVSFHVTDKSSYQGDDTRERAVADQGMWAVDTATGAMLDEHWTIRSGGLPEYINKWSGANVDDYVLLGAGREAAARSAVLLLKGALPSPSPSATADGSGG